MLVPKHLGNHVMKSYYLSGALILTMAVMFGGCSSDTQQAADKTVHAPANAAKSASEVKVQPAYQPKR